jgi:hypothetical protein
MNRNTKLKFKMITQIYQTSNWMEYSQISMKDYISTKSFKIVKKRK